MFQQSSYGGSPSPDLMLKEGNLRRVSVYMIVCRVLGLDLFNVRYVIGKYLFLLQ